MDITKLSITELKALAFDIIAQIELSQNNLRAVQQEIAKKQKEAEQPAPSVEQPKTE